MTALLELLEFYKCLSVVDFLHQVVLKIIKHCKEFSPALVTGQLLGLDVGSVLEVTNCFPFPVWKANFCLFFLHFFWFYMLKATVLIFASYQFVIVMHCMFMIFNFQIREEDEEIEAEGANYQLEMMRCLREVNVDNNTVGW